MTYEVTFERYGRTKGDEPVVKQFEAGDEDGLAYEIWAFGKTRMASNDYTVTVTLDADRQEGAGSIGAGRYGRFTVRALGTAGAPMVEP